MAANKTSGYGTLDGGIGDMPYGIQQQQQRHLFMVQRVAWMILLCFIYPIKLVDN